MGEIKVEVKKIFHVYILSTNEMALSTQELHQISLNEFMSIRIIMLMVLPKNIAFTVLSGMRHMIQQKALLQEKSG